MSGIPSERHFVNADNKVIHGDLKSKNILLSRNCGTAKLSDVGMARFLASTVATGVGFQPSTFMICFMGGMSRKIWQVNSTACMRDGCQSMVGALHSFQTPSNCKSHPILLGYAALKQFDEEKCKH